MIMLYLLYRDVVKSCAVSGTGAEEDCLLERGMHLGTALPEEVLWLLVILREGTEPAGAVLIKLKKYI